ncbi:MAG: Crp/Fnr family transcriptional regulator [Phenylobacterium sp.]|uniref:Crp/Fnr family transcriptional regulator n=1 Tax=Phenylobacterium sp. TaxID=1871053 RepID=UPI0027348AE6|nr:Crp/Fnr family transcriptional regulator [Phenylobacterium sp.]MDP3746642.1 Crp/Fnr family transcriptional regulator [Phenylobacterium sp.]
MLRNGLLAALGDAGDLLSPHLRDVTLRAGAVLCEPGDDLAFVYFLHEGAVSKLAAFESGAEIECALIGREGAVGAAAVFGVRQSLTRDVCLVEARASRIEAERLRQACARSAVIDQALRQYVLKKFYAAMRSGACNGQHPVEQRLPRWLLAASDALGSAEIVLPQDAVARMLGVQRSSVNPVLQDLQAAGIVALGRGRLTLLDRPRLLGRACECYAAVRGEAAPFASYGRG